METFHLRIQNEYFGYQSQKQVELIYFNQVNTFANIINLIYAKI